MNDTPDTSEILKFKEKFDRDRDLSPIEHILIGSGVSLKDGTIFNFDKFAEEVRSGHVSEELTPELFTAGGAKFPLSKSATERLMKRRSEQKELGGVLPFLEHEGLFDLLESGGYQPFLELSGLIDENGKIEPNWILNIVNEKGEEVVDKEIKEPLYQKLSLNPSYQEFFTLDHNPEDNLMVLSLKQQD